METIRKLPVRTRLPGIAWAVAGLMTLFSLVASAAHINVAPDRSILVVKQMKDANRASLSDVIEILRVFLG